MLSQANFAKWEPWHGKFGLCYPWDKYLQVGELLRELAAIIVSLEVCIQSSRQVLHLTLNCLLLLLPPIGFFS